MSDEPPTPGPWEVHEGDDYIIVLRGDETTDQGIRVDNIADAKLIAAAPELLAALRAFVDPWSKGGEWERSISYDTYNNARKAVAKVASR